MRVKYGLARNIRTFVPHRVAFHEFAARDVRGANSWRQRRLHVPRPRLVAARAWRRDAGLS
ncbi:MAG: hypothetical protein WA862_12590 [Solirubrobacterales bacterium]